MITVVDALPGTGKTTAIINKIRESGKDQKWLYVTPTLKEAEERIPEALKEFNFRCPRITKSYPTKQVHFGILVENGSNIATTHSLFLGLKQEVVDSLVRQGYKLVIDEAIDCMGVLPERFKESDAYALLKGDFISVCNDVGEDGIPDGRGRVVWREDNYPNHDGQYAEIRDICKSRSLFCFNDKFLISEYPPYLLEGIKEVYVLTYLFSGSDMRSWLELNNIPWQYADLEDWGLKEANERAAKFAKTNLTLLSNNSLDALVSKQRKNNLSKQWYVKSPNTDLKAYVKTIQSIVANTGIHRGDMFWTCFIEFQDKMKGRGYSQDFRNGLPSFVPKNIKATNDYKDCSVAMHMCNVYRNPVLYQYLRANGVEVEQDETALAELVQFIYRGCIRQGKPQQVIILSRRMRELFERWRASL